jgi:hypothetical protein
MADQEAVDLLCAGVSEWNRARGETMDLTHVEIRSADFRGADFHATDFDGTRLADVNFSGADLRRSRFNGVSATEVDFRQADFLDAEIKGTDLIKCCLDGARLKGIESYLWKVRHTSFAGAELHASKLHHAHFYNCAFSRCEFTGKDFEYVDIKRGDVSRDLEQRLAHAGVHFELARKPNVEDWLDWRTLSPPMSTAEYGVVIHNYEAYWISENRWDVFISYQTTQKDLAADLARQLRERSLRVWFDSAALRANESLSESIDSGLGACPFGVVVLSKEYFGRKWTEYELEKLLSKRMVVILHRIQPDVAISQYPGLNDKIMLTSDLGIKSLSHMITETIRRPPRHLPSAENGGQS